jgi:hypothetical protein
MCVEDVIRKLKAEGKLGDYVYVADDGMIMLRARTVRDCHRNLMRVRKQVLKYMAKEQAQ